MQENIKSAAVLEHAQRLCQEYYASCFWHWKRVSKLTEERIPAVVKGLCT